VWEKYSGGGGNQPKSKLVSGKTEKRQKINTVCGKFQKIPVFRKIPPTTTAFNFFRTA